MADEPKKDEPEESTASETDEQDTAKATPEAIARRVAVLDEEDESERVARAEEEKLAERRRKMREERAGKGKKKSGLEAAASKRLSKIGGKAPPTKRVATAVDADPLIEKTLQFSKWVKKNQKSVGVVVAVAAVGALAYGGYAYSQRKRENNASVALASAVADQRGRIGDPSKEEDDPDMPKDPSPVFKTVADRREAALTKYRQVESQYQGTGAAYLARLGEASLLLDKQDLEGASTAYNDVLASPLAAADNEVKGRALEGLGFVKEIKASQAQGADADKFRDEAIKTFHELEGLDVLGFKELGMYHQARVYEAKGDKSDKSDKGDKDRAKELLKSLYERATKPGEGHPFPMLQQLAEDRLRALDPSALPPKQVGQLGGFGGGGKSMSAAQMRQLEEMMRKMQLQQKGGQGGAPPP